MLVLGENTAYELSAHLDGRGAADLPKDVAILTAIGDQHSRNGGARRRNEGAGYLEDPDRIGVTESVERKGSRQPSRGRKAINARHERHSTEIRRNSKGVFDRARLACQIAVRSGVRQLSQSRRPTRSSYRPGHDGPGRKTCDRCACVDTHVSGDDGRAGIGHLRVRQDREVCAAPRFGATCAMLCGTGPRQKARSARRWRQVLQTNLQTAVFESLDYSFCPPRQALHVSCH